MIEKKTPREFMPQCGDLHKQEVGTTNDKMKE
jgi:hypothetical protein